MKNEFVFTAEERRVLREALIAYKEKCDKILSLEYQENEQQVVEYFQNIENIISKLKEHKELHLI